MDKDIFCQYDKIKDDILYETKDFFVKVGFGLITPGHVMLVPKSHYDSFADLSEELKQEGTKLKRLLIQKITAAFSEPFLVEYGNCGSVAHAHIHFIPKKGEGYEIQDIVTEMVSSRNIPHTSASKEKAMIYKSGDCYVSIEDNGKFSYIPGTTFEEWWDDTDYRKFFSEVKGFKGVRAWSSLTREEKILDEHKREITKKILRF